jgi:hypothetical protein
MRSDSARVLAGRHELGDRQPPLRPRRRHKRRVHDRQIRHEPVRARVRGRVPRRRHRLERPVAAHSDRDRPGAEPARRRRGHGLSRKPALYADAAYASSHHPAAIAPATRSRARTCSPMRGSPTSKPTRTSQERRRRWTCSSTTSDQAIASSSCGLAMLPVRRPLHRRGGSGTPAGPPTRRRPQPSRLRSGSS